ncbi:hypothetical protein OIV83_003986 [Microbotryomycetes sp. JL201]|nr:hypothetical protein OIV83_003986 [Microbotryomycetes sp. JL201]
MASGAGPSAALRVGQRVQVSAGVGHVRFVGQTSFAAGKWVGVELDAAGGKNDGSVNGTRYFDTQALHGVFVRPSQVKVIDDTSITSRSASRTSLARPLSATQARPSSVAAHARRPSSVLQETSEHAAVPERALDNSTSNPSAFEIAHPISASATSALTQTTSPAEGQSDAFKLPATPLQHQHARKDLLSAPTSMLPPPPSPSRTLSRAMPTSVKRTLVDESAVLEGRAAQKLGQANRIPAESSSGRPRALSRVSDTGRQLGSPEQDARAEDNDMTEQTLPPRQDPFSLRGPDSRRLAEPTVPRREHEELQAKLRILEARRAEDRDRLRMLESLQEESQEWDKIKEKTKSKIAELAADVRELKRQNKEIEAERDDLSSKLEELQDQVELTLLDKEMAEEKHESLASSLEAMKEKCAELDVELNVLREENARMTGEGEAEIARHSDEGGAQSHLAFVQLRKQNERLREALLRMRDLTSQSEAESKRKIADLEKELTLTSDLQSMYENNVVELERAEAHIEDLKAQLDDALGAEDLLEQLTERNLNLSERIDEMKAVVEDLEALKELNDELEESHVETERQMQEELDVKEMQVRQLIQRSESLEDSVAEYENTIGQFRELVSVLQSDIEQIRQQQETRETESQTLTSQSQAMLNLNMKLQSTVMKSQVKAIELELRKLDALQATERLDIIRPYLSSTFVDEDAGAVDALLFFERVAFKADLISSTIEQQHNISESLTTVVPEAVISACEARATLANYAGLGRRFAGTMRRCDAEIFVQLGRVYNEVAPTEKRLDMFIDALRKESLRESDCKQEITGLIAQFEHLFELHLHGTALELAERQFAYVSIIDLDFDTIAAATGFAKQTVATLQRDADVSTDSGEDDLDATFYTPLQNLVNQARTAKAVSKKLYRRMQDLAGSSSALALEHAAAFETLAFNSSTIATAVTKLANKISEYCSTIRFSREPVQLSSLQRIAAEIASSELGKQSARPLEEVHGLLFQLTQDVSTTLTVAQEQSHVVRLDYDPPWLARVALMQSRASVNVDAERKLAQLNEEVRDLVREARTKEQLHQESLVKIELMEKRMGETKKQQEAMAELQAELAKSKKQERTYEEAIETLQGDLDAMEQELSKLKQNGAAIEKPGGTRRVDEPVAFEGNMDTVYLIEQIESLRGAVRFLRQENAFIKSGDLASQLDALPALPSRALLRPDLPLATDVSTIANGVPKSAFKGDSLPVPTDARAFAVISRALVREVRLLSCSPRLVDVSKAKQGGLPSWQPKHETPRGQLQAERDRVSRLRSRVQQLIDARPLVYALR